MSTQTMKETLVYLDNYRNLELNLQNVRKAWKALRNQLFLFMAVIRYFRSYSSLGLERAGGTWFG